VTVHNLRVAVPISYEPEYSNALPV